MSAGEKPPLVSREVDPVKLQWFGDVWEALHSVQVRLRFLSAALDNADRLEAEFANGELLGASNIVSGLADEVLNILNCIPHGRDRREVPS